MPLNDEDIAKFKQVLREMSNENLRLELDIGTISLGWKRSLAEMEIKRREGEEWAARFKDQESARERAQQFQTGQMVKQLRVTEKQSNSAKHAAWAAWASALATIGLLVLTAIKVFGEPK